MIEKLQELESEFAKKLLYSVKKRIIERRQITVATLLAYLENPAFLNTTGSLNLTYSSRDEIAEEILELDTRLYPSTPTSAAGNDSRANANTDEQEIVDDPMPMPPKRSFSDELNDCVDEPTPAPLVQTSFSNTPLDDIKDDMASFEKNGRRSPILQRVYNALLSIPATSCEAER